MKLKLVLYTSYLKQWLALAAVEKKILFAQLRI